ncbi:amino acid adenylation domain-containing protein [Streptomyces sp. NPDC050264]|uniref:amino acid adenylation domain-containing protein n=1 Tax=Streptomyces sp. NPDC050264 TaxID=3155038 RepID=UPI0034241F38
MTRPALRPGTLHRAFEATARRYPARTAVTAPDATLTYAELDARAEQLASALRAGGAAPGTLVGLCTGRDSTLVIALLAILKTGAGYVPLDPAYPAARIQLLLADTRVAVVVATAETARVVEGATRRTVLADRPAAQGGAPRPPSAPPGEAGPDDVAYVIHTSGSTGAPKGVLVEHRQVLRLFEASRDRFRFGPQDVWTLFHSISFDFSVWELWGALLHGGRLVVVPYDTARSPQRMLDLLHTEHVTVLNQTPSAFRGIVAADTARADAPPTALRTVVLGGERLDTAMLRPWLARHGDAAPELVNMYGITETTVHVTHRRIRTADLAAPQVSPLGTPLADLRVRLLDEEGRPVPDGTPGEIYVWGAGLARGYLHRPELTAERFPFIDGERWYRSGDRALRTADGDLHHLGRADDQVKVRGYRIEPGEVEACLAADPGIATAVVTARDHGEGDVRLTAYILPTGHEPTPGLTERLDRLARTALPAHLRPSAYRVLRDLPLTPHGKTDRRRLDDFVSTAAPARQAPLPAVRPTAEGLEAAVDRIARDILECPAIDAHTDLRAYGATSLSLVRIAMRIRQDLGADLALAELGSHVTLRQLIGRTALVRN